MSRFTGSDESLTLVKRPVSPVFGLPFTQQKTMLERKQDLVAGRKDLARRETILADKVKAFAKQEQNLADGRQELASRKRKLDKEKAFASIEEQGVQKASREVSTDHDEKLCVLKVFMKEFKDEWCERLDRSVQEASKSHDPGDKKLEDELLELEWFDQIILLIHAASKVTISRRSHARKLRRFVPYWKPKDLVVHEKELDEIVGGLSNTVIKMFRQELMAK